MLSHNLSRGEIPPKVRKFEEYLKSLTGLPFQENGLHLSHENEERNSNGGYEEVHQQGYRLGYIEGIQQAKHEYTEKYAQELKRLTESLDNLLEKEADSINLWYRNSEKQLAQLAIVIAERLLQQELQHSKGNALALAQEGIKELIFGTTVNLRVNPSDVAILEAHKNELLQVMPRLGSIEIIPDESIKGGCLIETDGETVDARIESMLEKLIHEARSWK